MLLDAVLSLAARHRANSSCPSANNEQTTDFEQADIHRDALTFKHRAIHALSRAVSSPELRKADATVATVFLLIFLDLLESGRDRWNKHIEGAKSLMPLMGPEDPGHMVQQIRLFITKQIYLYEYSAQSNLLQSANDMLLQSRIETLGSALVRPRLITGFTSPVGLAVPDQDIIESFLGCPEYLLNAVRYFSLQRDSLAGARSTMHPSRLEQLLGLTTMLESVESFDGQLWARGLRRKSSSTCDALGLYSLFRSYQLAALLFGRRVHDALKNESTPQDDLVLDLLSVIASIMKDHPYLLKCTLWPIFIAGLECRDPSARKFITSALGQFYGDTRCINVANAAQILRDYWVERDQPGAACAEWIFDVSRLRDDWLLV